MDWLRTFFRTISVRLARRPFPRGAVFLVPALAALLLLSVASAPAHVGQVHFKIGVLAKRGTEQALAQWAATARYLSTYLPEHTFSIVPLDFSEIDEAVVRQQIDFILVNPAIYVGLEHHYGVSRIATMKNLRQGHGYTVFGGVIFCRAADSGIRTITDLHDKSFMAVDETSFGGWIAAWRELKEQGIDPQEDFARLLFGGTHDAVVLAVLDGRVDAGTVRTDTLERMAAEGKIDLADFRVLDRHIHGNAPFHEDREFPFRHSTRLYPEWPFAKLTHTSEEHAKKVATALFDLPQSHPAARAAKVAGWTIPLDYEAVHECLKELHLGPYADLGKVSLVDVVREYGYWLGAFLLLFAAISVSLFHFRRLNRRIRQSEEAITAAHAELAQIFHASADGIRVIDKEFNVVRINNTLGEMMGLSAAQAVNRKCYDTFPGPACHTPDCTMNRIKSGERQVQDEVEKTNRQGRKIPCMISASPFLGHDGKMLGIVEFFRDITDRKAAEDALQSSQAELVRTMRIVQAKNREIEKAYGELKRTQSQIFQQEKMASIGQLAAGVAHEINNPMGFITSNLNTLAKYVGRVVEFLAVQTAALESADPAGCREELKAQRKRLKVDLVVDDTRDLLNESLEGAERVKTIVANLKSFSRVDQQQEQQADINECIESTLNIVWNELKYKATVHREYGTLPLTRCYPQQLNQVFMNLLVNAGQAIEGQGEISIKTWAANGAIFAAVTDSGCGIPAHNISRLFEPFFTTKDVGKGTGLGLSITYDIIRKHDGEITVDSTEGRGTTFTVKIPVATA